MKVIILAIGDELVLGQNVDTNSAYLSAQLTRLGIGTRYHQTLADDRCIIADAITAATQSADLVLITGGLGPTEDDLTRQALADAMNQPLVMHLPSLDFLSKLFAKRDQAMPQRNKVQAMCPQGSDMLPNSCGTAPGIKATMHRATIYVMPGVPAEMVSMFEQSVLPQIDRDLADRQVILTTKINTFGLGESKVAEILSDLMVRDRNPKVGTTVNDLIVSVRVRSEFEDADHAKRELDNTVRETERRLGAIVYGRDHQTLQQSVIEILAQHGRTLATAESCTGGWLGKILTDVAGASNVYLGGWITYSNPFKTDQFDVDPAVLQQHGAVSKPIACAMAKGAVERSNADLALSITGIAGPNGGTNQKPIGTVWIGLADRHHATAQRFRFPGNRHAVRDRAAKSALQLVRLHLLNIPLDMLFSLPKSKD